MLQKANIMANWLFTQPSISTTNYTKNSINLKKVIEHIVKLHIYIYYFGIFE